LARLVNVTGLSSTMGAHFGSKRGQCVYLSARVLTPPCPPRHQYRLIGERDV
jgi:hypothetical protein